MEVEKGATEGLPAKAVDDDEDFDDGLERTGAPLSLDQPCRTSFSVSKAGRRTCGDKLSGPSVIKKTLPQGHSLPKRTD